METEKQTIASILRSDFFFENFGIYLRLDTIGNRLVSVGLGDTCRSNGLADGPFNSQGEFDKVLSLKSCNIYIYISERQALRLQV